MAGTLDSGMNPRLWRAFDEDNIEVAIEGDGVYFLPDHTWGDHDLLLVLGELADWAQARGAESRAANGLRNAFERELGRSVERAYQLVWTLVILEETRGRPGPIPAKDLASKLPATDANDDLDTRGIAASLAKRGLVGEQRSGRT